VNGIVIFLDALGMKGIWKRFKPSHVIKFGTALLASSNNLWTKTKYS